MTADDYRQYRAAMLVAESSAKGIRISMLQAEEILELEGVWERSTPASPINRPEPR